MKIFKSFLALFILSHFTLFFMIPAPAQSAETQLVIPWTVTGLKENLKKGMQMIYERSGTGPNGKSYGGFHRFTVMEADEFIIRIHYYWKDPLIKQMASGPELGGHWETIIPALDPKKKVKILKKEKISTPAGTFDTMVVRVRDDDSKTEKIYWLILDQPGIYAKIEDHGKKGKRQNLILTLQKVNPPSSN